MAVPRSIHKYFGGCSNIGEVKTKHREYVKVLHEAVGGDQNKLALVNEEYTEIKTFVKLGRQEFPLRSLVGARPKRPQQRQRPNPKERTQQQTKSRRYGNNAGGGKYSGAVTTDCRSIIDSLNVKRRVGNGREPYKPYWVYHQFIEIIESGNYFVAVSDFDYLGEVLGYKPGWGNIKYQEFVIKHTT